MRVKLITDSYYSTVLDLVFFYARMVHLKEKFESLLRFVKRYVNIAHPVEGSHSSVVLRALQFALCFAFHQRIVCFPALIC